MLDSCRRSLADVGQSDAADRDQRAVSEHFAFNLDDGAHSPDDPGTRLELLVRPRSARELEGSQGGHAQHAAGACLFLDCRRSDPACLSQQFDQDNRGNDRAVRKVPLKEPIVDACQAEAASRSPCDQVGDLLDEPHRRPMREQIDRKPP